MKTIRSIGPERVKYVDLAERYLRKAFPKNSRQTRQIFGSPEVLGLAFALESEKVAEFDDHKAIVLLSYGEIRSDIRAYARYYCAHLIRSGVKLPEHLARFAANELEASAGVLSQQKSESFFRNLILNHLLERLKGEGLSRNLAEEIVMEASRSDSVKLVLSPDILNKLRRTDYQRELKESRAVTEEFFRNGKDLLETVRGLSVRELEGLIDK